VTGRRAGFWTLLLELAMLAASLRAGGPIADGVRVIGLIVVGMVGALVVFVARVRRGHPRPAQAAIPAVAIAAAGCGSTGYARQLVTGPAGPRTVG
jgi:hypothetical protein